MSSTAAATKSRPASRLPATRERRPLLAALAVLLILLGASGAGYAALAFGAQDAYVAVNRDIPRGQQITRNDLGTVQMSGDTDGLIDAKLIDDIPGRYAAVDFIKGQLLVRQAMTTTRPIPAGAVVLPIQPVLVPVNLRAGDKIAIFSSDPQNPRPAPLVAGAEVVDVTKPASERGSATTEKTTVQVLLSPQDATTVSNSDLQKLAIGVLRPDAKVSPALGGR